VSFEVILVGEPTKTSRLPTRDDLLTVFRGYVISDKPGTTRAELAVLPGYVPQDADSDPSPFRELTVGTLQDGHCEISYWVGPGGGEPQCMVTIHRPLKARWLWASIHRLMVEFDLFMVYPGAEAAVVARPDVPLDDGIQDAMSKVVVTTIEELIDAITG
jgi:hypothetical protein